LSPAMSEAQALRWASQVAPMCKKLLPPWHNVAEDDITVKQLTVALSNVIFTASIADTQLLPRIVLFRVYGENMIKMNDAEEETNFQFYDQADELAAFSAMSQCGFGPRLLASGEGFRIEEFIENAPAVPTSMMSNPAMYTQVAGMVGRMHKLCRSPTFPVLRTEPCTAQRLRSWSADACKRVFHDPGQKQLAEELDISAYAGAEMEWLIKFLELGNTSVFGTIGTGYDVVFAHNDLQENNILRHCSGVRAVDFEYAAYNFAAYDIAQHFVEFTMDYNFDSYPFYSIDVGAYPSKEVQRNFASIYLSEFLDTPVHPTSHRVDTLLGAVSRFRLVSHALWSFWAVTRAIDATDDTQINFLHYARTRLRMYRRDKANAAGFDKLAKQASSGEALQRPPPPMNAEAQSDSSPEEGLEQPPAKRNRRRGRKRKSGAAAVEFDAQEQES